MGIDRIGKSVPPPTAPSEKVDSARIAEPGRPFEIKAPGATAAIDSPRTPLDRWKAGEIDVHGYLDAKVDEATEHLAAMPAPELETLRQALRERMASDPTLVDLVRAVTGFVPEPPSDR